MEEILDLIAPHKEIDLKMEDLEGQQDQQGLVETEINQETLEIQQ